MSIKNLFLPLLLSCFLASGPVAASETPTTVVRDAVSEVIALLQDTSLAREERRERMRKVIGGRFDFRAMGQTILATNWRKSSAEEQDHFVELFSQLLENTYVTAIESYTNESVEYPKEKIKGKRAIVDTLIVTATNKIPVSYKLLLKKDAGWFVYDVVIEGISLVSNYRSSFGRLVKQDGMAGLLTALERKIQELKDKQQAEAGATPG